MREVEALRARGLRSGAALESTLVLSEDGLVGGPLRWPDEFVRHKAGDILGDLALVGGRVQAHVVATNPSHQGNIALARWLTRTAQRVGGWSWTSAGSSTSFRTATRSSWWTGSSRWRAPTRIVGHQERHDQRAVLPGPFPGPPDHARRAHHRGDGAGRRDAAAGTIEDPDQKVVYFMSLDNVKFRRPVLPGDQLRCEVEMLQFRGRTCRMKGVALRGWPGRGGGGNDGAGGGPVTTVDPPDGARRSRRRAGRRTWRSGPFAIVGPQRDRRRPLPHRPRARRWSATCGWRPTCGSGEGSILGGDPQDLKYQGEETWVEVGDGHHHPGVLHHQPGHHGDAARPRSARAASS